MTKLGKKTSILWTTSSEKIHEVYHKSNSVNEFLSYFGMVNKGGNYRTLRGRLIHECLDYTKLKSVNRPPKPKDRRPEQEAFCVNSDYSRSALKRRIIKDKLIPYCCKKCGIGPEWQGEKLSLVLDHINGVYNDNRLDNLRFLCPNCNSQTETFAGKRHKKVKPPTNRHRPRPHKRKVERPAYERLLQEIEALGYCGVGRKYGVSDNAIRRWVKAYTHVV